MGSESIKQYPMEFSRRAVDAALDAMPSWINKTELQFQRTYNYLGRTYCEFVRVSGIFKFVYICKCDPIQGWVYEGSPADKGVESLKDRLAVRFQSEA